MEHPGCLSVSEIAGSLEIFFFGPFQPKTLLISNRISIGDPPAAVGFMRLTASHILAHVQIGNNETGN